jgi:SAM-dependent methyltransferase
MWSNAFKKQQSFYDAGYKDLGTTESGFPDLKIVDLDQNINGKRILSVGGGNGSDIWYLAEANEVYLLDSSAVAVKQANENKVQAKVFDVGEGLDFNGNFFDIVVLKDILEHIYDPLALLKEARRVLKNDGYIVVSLPNHFYLPFRLKILFGGNLIWKSLMHNHKKDFEEWNYMHIRFFTWAGVKKMFNSADLKIKKGYWDFGELAHYSDPDMYERAFKINNKKIENRRQWLFYKVFLPLYKIFNILFPKKIRAALVSFCPGLLCAGFYLKLFKN